MSERLAVALDEAASVASGTRCASWGHPVCLSRLPSLDAKIAGLEKELREPVHTGDERDGAADEYPGNRAAVRDGDPGLRAADGELPARPGLLGLAGPGSPPELDGGKPKLGKISKMGQRDLRRLLIIRRHGDGRAGRCGAAQTRDPWLARMLARKPRMLVAVALANRMARIAWALMTKNEVLPRLRPLPPEKAGAGAAPSGHASRSEDRVRANGQRDGVGKTSHASGVPSSTLQTIFGPDPRISIQARGGMMCRNQ